MPHETTILENEVGIQYQSIKKSRNMPGQTSIGGLIIGIFKRGRLDRPMVITNENIRGTLGYDPENPHYIAVQDALASGLDRVLVLRLIDKSNPNPEPEPEPPKDEHSIIDFDYAVIRYIWTSEGGIDLDTRTSIIEPPRRQIVGWAKQAADGDFLIWNSDNTGAGVESVLLNMQALISAYPNQKIFEIEFKAFWYNTKLSGAFQLQVQTYKGGVMVQEGYDYVNEGGSSLQNLWMNAEVDTSADHEGYSFANLSLNTEKKTGLLKKGNVEQNKIISLFNSSGISIFEGALLNLKLINSGEQVLYNGSENSNEPLVLRNSSNQSLFE